MLTDPSYINLIMQKNKKGNSKIYIPDLLEHNLKDLCDADFIHFATFGLLNQSSSVQESGILFTADNRKTIETRLVIQLSVMRFLCNAEKSKLKLSLGLIFIVDPRKGIITDRIDVSKISEDEGIQLVLEDTFLQDSFVTFKKG